MCPDIADPENGQITFSLDNLAPFDCGTVAEYSCSHGFGLDGGATRTCEGDDSSTIGEWTGTAPTCVGESCNMCLLLS